MKTKLLIATWLALQLYGLAPKVLAQTATVEFASPTYTANELDGGVTIMLVRSAAGTGPNDYASVVVYVSGGTATSGVDYFPLLPSPYQVSFAGSTNASFQIGTFQDRVTEPDETIVLSLANPSGVTLGKQTNATVTIVNGGPVVSVVAYFGYSPFTQIVSENEKFANITVYSKSDTNLPIGVDYATKDGTGKAGVDYTPVSDTLAFAAGETEKTISIPLADDGLVDGDKTFRVCLTNATGGASILAGDATVFIHDNEVPANLDYSFGLDYSFDPIIGGAIIDLAALPDDKLLIAGYFTRVNGVERSGLACLNADGSLATAFQTRLLSAGQPGEVYQVTPLADGRVYIAGNFDSVNGVDRPGHARLLQDGSLDLSFAPTNLNYHLMIVQTDGKIIASSPEGLVRLNLDGRRDNSFVNTLFTWDISALAEHTDGKLLAAIEGQSSIIRLNMDGSRDNSFGPVYFSGPAVWQILVQPDQKILVAGTFSSTNGAPLTNLERLNADGSLDTGFHAETGFEDYFYEVNLAEDGKIIVLSGRPPWVRRLNADGSLDSTFPGFHLTGFHRLSPGATLTVYHVSVKSIGDVAYVYGNFFFINGARAYGLGRILLDVPLRTGMDIQTDETRGYSYYSYLQPAGENDGSLTAKIRRLGQTTGPATVTWATSDGTAKAGKDYLATSGTVKFDPLEVEKTVTVSILNNASLDGPRTLQLYLTNAVGAEFVAPPLTMTILDDEVGFEPTTIKRLADGSVRMIVQDLLFGMYLEVSSDLKNWTKAANLQWNYVSPFENEVIDPDAAQFPRRFYRVRAQ